MNGRHKSCESGSDDDDLRPSYRDSELAALQGAAFDRAYIQNELSFHATVNGALKDTLIPAADNAELKGLLETGLKLFGEHQHHAEQLAASVR